VRFFNLHGILEETPVILANAAARAVWENNDVDWASNAAGWVGQLIAS